MLKPDRLFFALGLIGLGVLSFVYGDFALQWQAVPASLPGRVFLAYASGAVLILSGAGLLSRRTATLSSSILLVYLLLWLLLLKLPHVVVAPLLEFNWLGFGEIAVIVAAGLVLFAADRGQRDSSTLKFATGENGTRIARFLFALALIPIGLSHFVYAPQTIGFVPAWLPFRPVWASLGGAGHIAAGLGVLFGVVPRLAAMLEAAMIGDRERLTIEFFPTANHAFLEAKTGGNAEIATLSHFAPGMFASMHRWLRARARARQSIGEGS